MLVLTRTTEESIRIGDDIEVMVLEVRGDKVRLGVTAPSCVPVHREEVWRAIQSQREADTVRGVAVPRPLSELTERASDGKG